MSRDGHVTFNKCFIIAEAGSNHNGSLDQAKRLVDVAKDAGADAVKFQLFRAKTLYPNKHIKVKYLKDMGIREGLFEIIRKFEMPYTWVKELYSYTKKNDIMFMTTPFDAKAVEVLNPYVDIFKIASYESLFLDLICAVKQTKKPLFISTGGCTEEEVDLLMKGALYDYLDKTTLLHCIAKYPAPLDQLQLQVIPHFSRKYGVTVGYSDHSEDPIIAPVCAVALGAKVIEKHFTLSKQLPGPDHAFAVEPDELQAMVKAVRMTEKTVAGSGKRTLQPCEKELYYYKRCLYSRRDLSKGHRIRKSDVTVLRNVGLKCDYFNPIEIDDLIGRTLKGDKRANDIITKEDVT
ncbi:MAG: N-acetylneuraminate synthase family protein [Candidatus Omnitrophica bacterium]|nr:N-acetylneuraminate synthase family protein [Candidatus Omnitrophota bacterium]